jgi:hypothetical protein
MGARCEGRVAPLMLDQGIGGSIARGAWDFLSLTLGDEDASWRKVRCSRVLRLSTFAPRLHSRPAADACRRTAMGLDLDPAGCACGLLYMHAAVCGAPAAQQCLQPASIAVQNGLEVRFLASGGHPVLLAQRNGFPTLLHNDFLFRCLALLLLQLSAVECD